MKHCLIILFAFCILISSAFAQSESASIDSLIKYKVVTADQRSALGKEIKNSNYHSFQITVLAGLESIMLQNTYHINSHRGGIYYGFGSDNLSKKRRDSINLSLHSLLERVNNAGLLNTKVYKHALNGIDSGYYMIDIQMIASLVEISSRLAFLTPNKLLPVAEQLHKNGIVNDSSFLALKNDIINQKIESAFQLNDYCMLDRTFDMEKYEGDAATWLEQIHRDISSMLPGLGFSNFNFTTTPDTSFSIEGKPATIFKISLTCDGRVYKHESTSLDYMAGKGKRYLSNLFLAGIYRIFNKILTDHQSQVRLNYMMFSQGVAPADVVQRAALIALTAKQAEVLIRKPCLPYLSVSLENYDNTFTSGRIDSTINEWKKMGLFAHLSDVQISDAIDKIESGDRLSVNRLLTYFPGVTYELDSLIINQSSPYANALQKLASITHGIFNPTEITQKILKDDVQLRYLSGGKVHLYRFNTTKGWLNNGFFSFIKHLAKENNLPGNFYQLRYEDTIIYLTTQQHDYALKHDMLYF